MDCQMPEMDGFEATKQIRAHQLRVPGAARVPILALTANAMQGDSDRIKAAGMDEHLTKPIRLETLADALDRWISGSRSEPL